VSAQEEAAVTTVRTRSPLRRAAAVLGLLALALAAYAAARVLWPVLAAPAPSYAAGADPGGAGTLLEHQPVSMAGHLAAVNGLALSPDGLLVASGSDDGTIDVCVLDGARRQRTLRGPERQVLAVDFAPDGRRLAAACGEMIWGHADGVYVFDVRSGTTLARLTEPQSASASVAFSPDGRFLAAGTGCAVGSCETVIHVWDAATLEHDARLAGHDGAVGGLAWSPDSTRLASASADGSVRLWDAETGEQLARLDGHDAPVICVAWSPDGTLLASGGGHPMTGGGNHVLVWEAATGRRLLTLQGHRSTVFSVAFAPDGVRLASASGAPVPLPGALREPDASVRLWDVAIGESLAVLPVAAADGSTMDGLWSVLFSRDGTRLLAGADDGRVLVWSSPDR
jgi:WD40 repeat protein